MDQVDVLGPRPDRHTAFTRELLAEADDGALQEIVERAARELSAPIALVTLVLDQVQFFKAHYGLPPDLSAARGTRRDVSFCQFVVLDSEAFEVQDAPNDPRVPQHLVNEYGIRSYLGVPVRAQATVIGSLCVIDTEERRFSDDDLDSLTKLAVLVDERVAALTERRRQTRLGLSEKATDLGLAELRVSLAPIRGSTEAGLPALTAIRSYLRLAQHVLEGGSASREAQALALDAAGEAADAMQDALYDIQAAAADCEDSALALESLTTPSAETRLSDVMTAAQDLARQSTAQIGGAPLPDLGSDTVLYTPRPLAVALLSTCLMNVAGRLAELSWSGGLDFRIRDLQGAAEVAVSADALTEAAAAEIAARLIEKIGQDPSVAIHAAPCGVRLVFTVVSSDDAS